MSTINLHYATMFKDAFLHRFQLGEVPLMKLCEQRPQNVERQTYDIIDPVAESTMTKIKKPTSYERNHFTGEYFDTKLTALSHRRRVNYAEDHDFATMISRLDNLKLVADPSSQYVQNATMFMKRRLNRLIATALSGSVQEEKLGDGEARKEETISFPSQQVVVVSNFQDGIIQAKERMDASDINDESRFLVCSSFLKNSLLNSEKATSIDYVNGHPMVTGRVGDQVGFELVTYNQFNDEELTVKEKKERYHVCYAVSKYAMIMGMAQSLQVHISDRPDKKHNKQIYLSWSAGAMRLYDEGVVKILIPKAA